MTQVWANFVVSGGGGCACCGGSPSCNAVCVMTFVTGCPKNPGDNCSSYSYPYTSNVCSVTADISLVPCPCFDPPSAVQTTGNVYLELMGLTALSNYSANVFFNISDDSATSSYEWIFTASNSSENTTATNIPNPNTTDDMGWYVVGCEVNAVP